MFRRFFGIHGDKDEKVGKWKGDGEGGLIAVFGTGMIAQAIPTFLSGWLYVQEVFGRSFV